MHRENVWLGLDLRTFASASSDSFLVIMSHQILDRAHTNPKLVFCLTITHRHEAQCSATVR
jgi:hypothetical protein